MKLFLAWLLLVRIGLGQPHADNHDTGTLEPKQTEGTAPKTPIGTPRQDVPPVEPRADPRRSEVIETREELLPGTKSYSVWVTDRENESQISDTQKWLENLVKDKSQMFMWKDFPWGKEKEVPEDEINKLIDEGRFDEIDKWQQVGGWWDVILDQAGYEEVAKKKDWIAYITETRGSVEMSPVSISQRETPRDLKNRKVEWGDWEKQENAIRDLVQASQYE